MDRASPDITIRSPARYYWAIPRNVPASSAMFRFIHAADIHLDSPLRGLERYEGAPVDQIRNAARRAFENLLELAISEKVSFLVISGDLYDGDWRDYSTGLYFVQQIRKLQRAGIPVFLIAGNHDANNKMTRSLNLPDHVTMFRGDEPHTVLLDDLGVAIHGQSFATAAVHEDLSMGYPPAVKGYFNLGILHTCGNGQEGHDPYAPCTISGLKSKGYDYWALGHIHKREVLCESPFVAFSGNLQGRHVRETGAKGALMVTVHDDGALTTDFRTLDVVRWEVLSIDLSDAEALDQLYDRARLSVREALVKADGRTLCVRIEVTGKTQLHAELHAKRERVTTELRSCASDEGLSNVWVEKVKIRTSPPGTGRRDEDLLPDDALNELTKIFSELRNAPELLGELKCSFQDIEKKISEAQMQLDIRDNDWFSGMVSEAEARLMRQLHPTEEQS